MVLRPYQTVAADALRERVQAGRRRVLLVSPTGSGKTVILAEVIHGAVARGTPVLFLAHRKELIDQCSSKLDAIGVDHGVIQAQHDRERPWLPVQVASIPTLARRPVRPAAGLVIVDEAHHARAGTYAKVLDAYPNAPVIGATATPWRNDGRGLGELFEDLVIAARPRELIDQGHLVPYTGYAYDAPDAGAVRRRGNDYDPAGLDLVMGSRALCGNIIEQWLLHAGGARSILFAVNVQHSRALAQRFLDAGVAAEHLDGETPGPQRDAILRRLAAGATRVLCNVGVLTEGFDCPSVEVIILARPTLSVTFYLQMIGRGMRPWPGKVACRIHDHAGCFLEHGAPDVDRDYSLDGDEHRTSSGERPPPLRTCKNCLRIYDPAADGQACPACGQVNAPSKREIREITAGVRAIPLSSLPQFSNASAERKAATLEKLRATATERGYASKWADIQYKVRFGHWPPGNVNTTALDVARAAGVPPRGGRP